MATAECSGRRKAYPRLGWAQDVVADRATLVSPIFVAMALAVAESGPGCGTKTASRKYRSSSIDSRTVSYTHLTLPTICSV